MKSKIGLVIIVLSLVTMAISGPVLSQEETGSVTGTVWDNHMVSLPDMDVYILDNPNIITTTDQGGVFILENVPEGDHTLVLYKSGYDRQTIDITVTAGNITSVGDPMVKRISLSEESLMLIVVLILIVMVIVLLAIRKVILARKTIIDEVFFMYNDGRLIKHFTRRLKPDMDSDILSSMLVAVQEFVKDSFRGEPGALDQMKFGRYQILIARGNNTIIAAMILGDDLSSMRQKIQGALSKTEAKFADALNNWDGDMDEMAGASAHISELLIEK